MSAHRAVSIGAASGLLLTATLSDAVGVADAPSASLAAGGGAITHGSQITAANTGHTAYTDPTLGRLVTDADLTVHAGLVSASDFAANGGTITRRDFRAGIIMDRSDVTFVACKFNGEVSGYNAGVDYPFTLRWCSIDTSGTAGDQGISFTGYTAYRCRVGGCSDGAKINGDVTITECFIRVKGQSTADHNDGVQNFGGIGPVTVERSNIDCRPTNGIGAPNAALFAADSSSGLMTWTDNWVAGGGYVIRCYENCTYNVQGNQVLDGSWVFGPTDRAVIPASSVTWGTVRPNVLVDGSGATVATLPAP